MMNLSMRGEFIYIILMNTKFSTHPVELKYDDKNTGLLKGEKRQREKGFVFHSSSICLRTHDT